MFLPGRAESLRLSRRSPSLRLLQRARDEAHRFGLAYNRKRRTAAHHHLGAAQHPRRRARPAAAAARALRQPGRREVGLGGGARHGAGLLDPAGRAGALAPERRPRERRSPPDWISSAPHCGSRRATPTACPRSATSAGSRGWCAIPTAVPTLVGPRRAAPPARHVAVPCVPAAAAGRGAGHSRRRRHAAPARAPRPAQRLGLDDLLVKDEGTNPTGSFKARGLRAAITRAVAAGADRLRAADRRQRRRRRRGLRRPGRRGRCGSTHRARRPRTILSQIVAFGADLVLLDGHIGDCGKAARAYAARDRGGRSLHPARAVPDRGQEDARPRAGRCSSAGPCPTRSSTRPGAGPD